MKDAFWTAGAKNIETFEHVEKTIKAKWQDEQPKPKAAPKPPAPAARACKECGRITNNPCR
jgi:hypothetical protein